MSTAASPRRCEPSRLIVVMGVAGCGKSTIGEALAAALQGVFLDGDAYHPQANIDKMSRGEPLTDEDRWPWLERFARALAERPGRMVGGCSALKRAYRTRITEAAGESVMFVHLIGSRDLIAARMKTRTGHFMPLSLLDSQFAALEPPGPDENAVAVDIDAPIEEIVTGVVAQMEAQAR